MYEDIWRCVGQPRKKTKTPGKSLDFEATWSCFTWKYMSDGFRWIQHFLLGPLTGIRNMHIDMKPSWNYAHRFMSYRLFQLGSGGPWILIIPSPEYQELWVKARGSDSGEFTKENHDYDFFIYSFLNKTWLVTMCSSQLLLLIHRLFITMSISCVSIYYLQWPSGNLREKRKMACFVDDLSYQAWWLSQHW